MKIAALSLLSATGALAGGPARARSSSDKPYDVRRDGDRRRKSRIIQAARISPEPFLTTGLAMQVIAQLENASSAADEADRIEAARAAYRHDSAPQGVVINFRA